MTNTNTKDSETAGNLKVTNFHCSEHGYVTPRPVCPKCSPEDVLKGERRRIIEQIRTEVKADWLRSEIEKLEGEFKEVSKLEVLPEDGYNTALTSIITRYKEELKVLERKQDDWNEDMERNEELMNDNTEELLELEKGV